MIPIISAPGAAADLARRRRRLLGVGLRADPVDRRDVRRDVSLRRTAAGVDLDLADGIDAFVQDLAVALTTVRGSDPFNTGFGFLGLGSLSDRTSPAIAREAVRSAVAQVIAADPRVRRITDVTVTDPGDRTLAIAVSFESISGDPATVTTSGLEA